MGATINVILLYFGKNKYIIVRILTPDVICIEGKPPQLFEKSAVPFLPELKYRRQQFDILQANSFTTS